MLECNSQQEMSLEDDSDDFSLPAGNQTWLASNWENTELNGHLNEEIMKKTMGDSPASHD